MKKLALAVCFALSLSACGDPKSVVIPPSLEGEQGAEFAEKIKTLPEDDKSLLTGFIAMSEIGKQLGGDGIPAGTTVGEALVMANKWAAKVSAQNQAEKDLKAQEKAKLEAAKAMFKEAITAAVVDKTTTTENYQRLIKLTIAFKNNTDKQIDGIKGKFVFYDSFDEELSSFEISEDQINLSPGESKREVLDYSIYLQSHVKISELPLSKLKTEFIGDTIVFSDGNKIQSPD